MRPDCVITTEREYSKSWTIECPDARNVASALKDNINVEVSNIVYEYSDRFGYKWNYKLVEDPVTGRLTAEYTGYVIRLEDRSTVMECPGRYIDGIIETLDMWTRAHTIGVA